MEDKLSIAKFRDALKAILADPYGCPTCDCGTLRDANKQHWDDCPYLIAYKLLILRSKYQLSPISNTEKK